jgi:thioesterase domain-containing protein
MGPQETWLHMAPTSFDASTLEIWAALLHGGRCVVLEESVPTPAQIAAAIRGQGVSSAWFTAALFNALVDEAPETLAGLAQVLVGGEALSPAHMQRAQARYPGVRFVNGYGPTENTTFTCCHVIEPADLESGRAIPIGRPIANTSVQVLDRDGQLVPTGVPGELVAGGDGVALGYTGKPDANALKFLADTSSGRPGARLYRTGDRVRWRPDGRLEFLGRFDEQLKIRGQRIEPGEIAACLAEHAGVRRAAVVARASSAGAPQLVAYVVAQGAQRAADLPRLLQQHAAERLPAYMLPAAVVLVPDLPLKPNGKLDLEALEQAPAAGAPAAPAAPAAPLTPAETRLLAIWREALKQPVLGVDDDFFAAGGDSLLAVRMLARAERELGSAIPVRSLVEGRSVRRIAAQLASAPGSQLPPGVVRVREGDPRRALFCLPGLGGVALQFERLAGHLRTQRAVYAVELHDIDVGPEVLESLVRTGVAVAERLRAVQPRGPYSILGYSYGGNVAVEVARELIRQGQQVELVAVLDSYAPGSLRAATGLGKILRHVRVLRRLGPRGFYGYLAPRVLRRLGLKGPEEEPARPTPTTEFERRLQETETRGMRAFREYHPVPFEGRILLVHATDLGDWMETADPSGTCGWGAICTGGVDLIHIGCKHLDLFRGENIAVLAQRLDEVLESVQGP